MKRSLIIRGLVVGAFVVLAVALAVPASAQTGTLRGKVIDATGQPVVAAEIILDFAGDRTIQMKTKTDNRGEWVQAGVLAAGGVWNLTVKKGDVTEKLNGIRVRLNDVVRVPDIKFGAPAAAGATGGKVQTSMSKEETAARDKKKAELEAKFNGANADIAAGNYDAAITKVSEIAVEIEKCAPCATKIGEAYLKKGDEANAEKFFLQGIEYDPANPDPYKALATLYNGQKKFDEAAKMSAKANELSDAGASGGDASSVYNTGIIFWNQGKGAEALAQFERAIKLDPKMADAHYWLGMALVNQGKLAEAKVPFTEYIKLAPSGEHAEQAKELLKIIK
jgi:Flp pilus assembly protein TadD